MSVLRSVILRNQDSRNLIFSEEEEMVKYLVVSVALLATTSAALATSRGPAPGMPQTPPLRHVPSYSGFAKGYTLRSAVALREPTKTTGRQPPAKDRAIKRYVIQEQVRPQDAQEKQFYAVHPVKIRPSQEGLGKANVEELMEVNFYKSARQLMAQGMDKQSWIKHGSDFLTMYVTDFQMNNVLDPVDDILREHAELKARGASAAEKNENFGKMYDFFKDKMLEAKGDPRTSNLPWESVMSPGLKPYFRKAVESHSTSKEGSTSYADVLYGLYEKTYHSPTRDPSPGIIDPDGMPSLSDGHHGLSQAYTLMERIKGLDPQKKDSDFNVILNITENFSLPGKKLKYGHYLMDLCEKRKLYFSPKTRADIIEAMKHENKKRGRKGMTLSASEHVDELAQAFEKAVKTVFAKDIKGMAHDPMRSFVGALLPNLEEKFDPGRNHRARLTNKVMVDFAEFYVSEWLVSKGFTAAFNEKTIQLSRPDRLDPHYNKLMANYVLTLKGMQDARELIYGKMPEEFRRDVLVPLFDQVKFDACEKDAKAKGENVSKACPNFLEEFDTQLARYQKDYSKSWPGLATSSAPVKSLLANLTPDNVGVKVSPVVQSGAPVNPNCVPKASQSLANLAQDLAELTAGGTCLNPLKRAPDELLAEIEQGSTAAAAAGTRRLIKITEAVNLATPDVIEAAAKAAETGWINFR